MRVHNENIHFLNCVTVVVVTNVEKSMLRWFGLVERMSCRGNPRRRRPKRTYNYLISEVGSLERSGA